MIEDHIEEKKEEHQFLRWIMAVSDEVERKDDPEEISVFLIKQKKLWEKKVQSKSPSLVNRLNKRLRQKDHPIVMFFTYELDPEFLIKILKGEINEFDIEIQTKNRKSVYRARISKELHNNNSN